MFNRFRNLKDSLLTLFTVFISINKLFTFYQLPASPEINLPETEKASLISELTARHGLSPQHKRSSSSRRKLPSAPESSDESFNHSAATKEENTDSHMDNSNRSSNLSSNIIGTERFVQGSRESISSRFLSSKETKILGQVGGLQTRSNSHLSSAEQHFSTWKKNKDNKSFHCTRK